MPWSTPSTRSRRSDAGQWQPNKQGAYELCSVDECRTSKPTSVGARTGQNLSIFVFRTGRLSLPAPANLLGICRRGARPLWSLGGRLDDLGATLPLPSVGNGRN